MTPLPCPPRILFPLALTLLVVLLPPLASASAPLSTPDPPSASSDCYGACDNGLSAPSIIALVIVALFFLLLLCWCASRVMLATVPSRPVFRLLSLCRRSTPQIHLSLHSDDAPSPSPPSGLHPSSLSLYPFRGSYRIGGNAHLSPFTLLARFDHSAYPRTVTGHGVDDATAFVLSDGLFTVHGAEQRCTWTERFEDGSRYEFSGVSEEAAACTWKGRWWKVGGDQRGTWSMEPHEDRWREMQRQLGEAQSNGVDGSPPRSVGEATVGDHSGGQWIVRNPPVRFELEERKEAADRDEGRAVERRSTSPADVIVEMAPVAHHATVQPFPAAIGIEA